MWKKTPPISIIDNLKTFSNVNLFDDPIEDNQKASSDNILKNNSKLIPGPSPNAE
jgi:hypothetical protein